MKNIKDFSAAVAPLCVLCDNLHYTYEILRPLDVLDSPDDLRMSIYSGDSIITDTIIRAIPSSLDFVVSLDSDNRLRLLVW